MNIVIVIGKLAREVAIKEIKPGLRVGVLPIHVERTFRAKDGSEQKESFYIDVSVWNQEADRCASLFKQGEMLAVKGRLRSEKWKDKTTGTERSRMSIQAESVEPTNPELLARQAPTTAPAAAQKQSDFDWDALPF